MIGILAAQLLTGALAPVELLPSEVFENLCIEDSANFDQSRITQVDPRSLSEDQHLMLTFLLNATDSATSDSPFLKPIKASAINGTIFSVSGADGLVLIAPNGEAEGELSSLCAVFSRGDSYLEAKKAVSRITSGDDRNTAPPRDTDFFLSIPYGEHFVAAGRTDDGDWTMLASLTPARQQTN